MKFLALALVVTSFTAVAGTTGTLNLKGKVPLSLSLTLTAESIATVLPLDISQVDTKVATVNEKSNAANGYKVTITSTNLGKLKRQYGTQTFNYVLKYDNVVLDLSAPIVQAHPGVFDNVNKDVSISYTGIPSGDMAAGDYLDTVKFTIAAN